jgi:hypothetical protein
LPSHHGDPSLLLGDLARLAVTWLSHHRVALLYLFDAPRLPAGGASSVDGDDDDLAFQRSSYMLGGKGG